VCNQATRQVLQFLRRENKAAEKDAHLKVVTAWESFLFRLSHVTRSTQQLMAAIFPAYLFWHIYSLTTQDSWRKLTAVWEIQL
jgi:hypothetical protein